MYYKQQPSELDGYCGMRCGHCGSACAESQEGELTTAEAFSVIDQLGDLGLKWLTLSGGEPLTRNVLQRYHHDFQEEYR